MNRTTSRPASHFRFSICLPTATSRSLATCSKSFREGRSALWLWCQLLLAVMLGSFRQRRVPVALNLTPIDPVVAEWLMDRALGARRKSTPAEPGRRHRRHRPDDSGLSLTTVVPDVWWFVVGGIASGLVLGTKVYLRRNHALPDERDGLLVRHYFM